MALSVHLCCPSIEKISVMRLKYNTLHYECNDKTNETVYKTLLSAFKPTLKLKLTHTHTQAKLDLDLKLEKRPAIVSTVNIKHQLH